MSTTLIALADLRRRGIKLSNTTMLKMEAEGKFPRRIYLTPRTVVWSAEAIDAHIAGLIQQAEGGSDDA